MKRYTFIEDFHAQARMMENEDGAYITYIDHMEEVMRLTAAKYDSDGRLITAEPMYYPPAEKAVHSEVRKILMDQVKDLEGQVNMIRTALDETQCVCRQTKADRHGEHCLIGILIEKLARMGPGSPLINKGTS